MPILEHSSAQIDEAISRALPGGGIDQEMAQKEPAIESTDYPGCYYRMVDGAQEWINPPMAVGVEYRTTERYNGKPVYVKAISCGAMPNATTTKVSDEFRATSIISVDGVTSGGTHFPTYSGHTASIGRIDVFVNIYGNIWITTTTDWSNETATIVLKYTKD